MLQKVFIMDEGLKIVLYRSKSAVLTEIPMKKSCNVSEGEESYQKDSYSVKRMM